MFTKILVILLFINSLAIIISGYAGTVTIQYGDDVVIDCEMTYVPYCYGDEETAGITYFSSNGRWERYYIRIPLPDFLYGEIVDSVKFHLYKIEISPHSNQSFNFTVNRLVDELTEYYEQNVGNIIAPSHHSTNFDTSATYTYDYLGWVDLDITRLVGNWLNLTYPNYGFLVRMTNESAPTQQLIAICQSLYWDKTKWPILEISGPSLPDTFITSPGISNLSNFLHENKSLSFSISNYPNPFNPLTHIEYTVPVTSQVTLRVYDVQGRLIITLVDEKLKQGHYQVDFDGTKLASGIYFYNIKIGKYHLSQKMLLNR
jgi:hypothetical protein